MLELLGARGGGPGPPESHSGPPETSDLRGSKEPLKRPPLKGPKGPFLLDPQIQRLETYNFQPKITKNRLAAGLRPDPLVDLKRSHTTHSRAMLSSGEAKGVVAL